MKKVLFSVLLSAIVLSAHSQLGISAGVNISKWRGNNVTEPNWLTGYNFSAYGNVPIHRDCSIESQVSFSMEGSKNNLVIDKTKMNYLSLTELFRHNTKSGFFVGTGPQLSFLLYAVKSQYGVGKFVKDEFKISNFSWAFAAGYDFQFGFGIFARYNVGLQNIAAKSGETIKQDVFQAGLRCNFKTNAK